MSSLITFEQIAQRIPDLSDYVDGDFVNPAEVAGDTLIYPGTLRGKPVIVKCRRFIEPNDEHNAQTLGEAAIWIQLRHVNIHPLLGVARPKTVPNTVFMVADCTVNGNALDYVQRHDINPSCLLLGIARALKYLHSRGVYHGYVRARNVLVDDDGRALLTSSCCSSVLASSETTTSPPVVCATRWMAPEGISDDDKPKDFAKMDVWAFGMTILELFTRSQPFGHEKSDKIIRVSILRGLLPVRPPCMTDEWWTLCTLCWGMEPALRPSMSTVVDIIEGIIDPSPETQDVEHPIADEMSEITQIQT